MLVSASFCWAQKKLPFEQSKYVAEVPGIGLMTIDLDGEYEGKRKATLLWLFDEIYGEWTFENERILFRRQPSHGRIEADPALIFKPQPDGTLLLQEGGLLKGQAAQLFAVSPWRRSNNSNTPEYRLSFEAHKQAYQFQKQGNLLPLPKSFPQAFMETSALLFRDRTDSIPAILKYPRLSSEVLDIVGDGAGGKFGDGTLLVSPILGAHPNLSERLQKKLFALPKEPAVWRAVAGNPSAPKSFYPEYLKRIREGDKNIRFDVARDRDAPREAWELALAPREPEVLNEFSRNPSAPADLLAQISDSLPARDLAGLAANRSTPPEVLERISTSKDQQVLWNIKRNPSSPPSAVEKVLRTLAESPGASLRDTCADDPRLPQDLIPKLAKDPGIYVRSTLARNKGVPLPVLEDLAKDPYQLVSESARNNIKNRFPGIYNARQAEWVPLDQLNPNNSLIQDFADAVKAGNVTKVREILAFTNDPDIKPNPSAVIDIILANNFEPFKDLLKQAITEGPPRMAESMINNRDLKPAQFR